jgi:hypothetical protein
MANQEMNIVAGSRKRALQLITNRNRVGVFDFKPKRVEGRRQSRIPKRFENFYAGFGRLLLAGGEEQSTATAPTREERRRTQLAPQALAMLQEAIRQAEETAKTVQGAEDSHHEEEEDVLLVQREDQGEEDAMDLDDDESLNHEAQVDSPTRIPETPPRTPEDGFRYFKPASGNIGIDLVSSDEAEEAESIDLGTPVSISKPQRVIWIDFSEDVELADSDKFDDVYGPAFGIHHHH